MMSPLLKLAGLSLLVCCSQPSYATEKVPAPAQDLPPQKGPQTLVVAGGCFWCVEAVFEAVAGVTDVVSGYAGDTADTATYEQVGSGRSKHAEAVKITYDPAQISYGALLQIFFATHDPTTLNRQGPDRGTQYRSTLFYASEAEKKVLAAYIAQLGAAKVFNGPVVTTLEPLTEFFPAEEYHQDFVKLHPDHPYVRHWSVPKLDKLKATFPERLRKK